jgi:cobalt/nickel transport system permease protein
MSGMHQSGVAGNPASRIHRLDPRAKIVGFAGITLVGVSSPPGLWPVLAACALALAAIAAAARVGPGVIWSRARVVLPLVVFVAVFVPFVRGGEQVDLGPSRSRGRA